MNKKHDDSIEKALNETDGVYEEYSADLADADDLEAQERADAADKRAKSQRDK